MENGDRPGNLSLLTCARSRSPGCYWRDAHCFSSYAVVYNTSILPPGPPAPRLDSGFLLFPTSGLLYLSSLIAKQFYNLRNQLSSFTFPVSYNLSSLFSWWELGGKVEGETKMKKKPSSKIKEERTLWSSSNFQLCGLKQITSTLCLYLMVGGGVCPNSSLCLTGLSHGLSSSSYPIC